jgi:hypothetical protein
MPSGFEFYDSLGRLQLFADARYFRIFANGTLSLAASQTAVISIPGLLVSGTFMAVISNPFWEITIEAGQLRVRNINTQFGGTSEYFVFNY